MASLYALPPSLANDVQKLRFFVIPLAILDIICVAFCVFVSPTVDCKPFCVRDVPPVSAAIPILTPASARELSVIEMTPLVNSLNSSFPVAL